MFVKARRVLERAESSDTPLALSENISGSGTRRSLADARAIQAISLAQSNDSAAGIAHAEQALAQAPDDGRVRYNVACAFARAGEPEQAIEQLRVMVSQVPNYLTDWVRRDPDFVSLRRHPEFVRIFGAD